LANIVSSFLGHKREIFLKLGFTEGADTIMGQKQAVSTIRPKNIILMYAQFSKAISIGDPSETRRLYRELLGAGQTSKELIDTAFHAVYEGGAAEAFDRPNDVLPNVSIRGDSFVLKTVNSGEAIGAAAIAAGPPGSFEHPIPAPIDGLPTDGDHSAVETSIREGADQPNSAQPEAKPNGLNDYAELQALASHRLELDGKTGHDFDEICQSPVVPSRYSAEAPQSRRKWGPSRRSWIGIGIGALAIASLAIALSPSRALHDWRSASNISAAPSTNRGDAHGSRGYAQSR
jgi:hypothetical protein